MTDLQKQERENFARMVRAKLAHMGKKPKDLATVTDVSIQTLSNWLQGLVDLSTYKDKLMAGLSELGKESARAYKESLK